MGMLFSSLVSQAVRIMLCAAVGNALSLAATAAMSVASLLQQSGLIASAIVTLGAGAGAAATPAVSAALGAVGAGLASVQPQAQASGLGTPISVPVPGCSAAEALGHALPAYPR